MATPVPQADELVGADRVALGRLEAAASYVVELLRDPGGEIRVVGGQLDLGADIVVPGHPDDLALEPVGGLDPGTVWAIDGGSCVVADGRAFQVAAFRAARVRFADGGIRTVDAPALDLRALSGPSLEAAARDALAELLGHPPETLPELKRPVDAFREWAEWRLVLPDDRRGGRG